MGHGACLTDLAGLTGLDDKWTAAFDGLALNLALWQLELRARLASGRNSGRGNCGAGKEQP